MLDQVLGQRGDHQRKSHLDRFGVFKRWETEISRAGLWGFRTDFGESVGVVGGFGQNCDGCDGAFALLTVAAMQPIVEETQRLMDK